MTDTQLILNRIEEVGAGLTAQMKGVEERIGKLEERVGKLEERVGRLEERVGRLESDVSQLKEDMEMMEINLSGQIEMVYKVAMENKSNIELLMPYQDKILFANQHLEKIDPMVERQDALEEIVQSHSEDIRAIKKRLA